MQHDRQIHKPRSAVARFAQDRHKRTARLIGLALVADDPATWAQTSALLAHHLRTPELASVAYAALRSLDPESREMVFEAAHWGASA